MKYVGIGYSDHLTSGLNFYFYNTMLHLIFWAPRLKRPKFYFYNKSQFEYSIEQRFVVPVVFFGLTFRDDSDF